MTFQSKMPVPAKIEAELKMWRMGAASFPISYIHHQEFAATEDLYVFTEKKGWKVHNTFMAKDGWGDGMMFVHAIIEKQDGSLAKIKFSDSQRWYEILSSGGSVLISEEA